MKKNIIIILFMSLFLYGCQEETDTVSQKVMDDINSIGEVTAEDKDLIENIEETYKILTDKQKEQVNNYDVLLEAKEKLEAERECVLEQERVYYPYIQEAVGYVKGECKHPASFQLNEVITKANNRGNGNLQNIFIAMNCTAKNDFGNPVSDYYGVIISATETKLLNVSSLYDGLKEGAEGYDDMYPIKISDVHYKSNEDVPYNETFIVDLQDYNEFYK